MRQSTTCVSITQPYVMDVIIRRRGLTLNDLAVEMNLDKKHLEPCPRFAAMSFGSSTR